MCGDGGVSLARLTCRPSPSGGGHPSFRSTYVSTPTDEHDQGVWLTQEAHDRLKAELDSLVAGRPAMSAEINARREEGDLRENGGGHPPQQGRGRTAGTTPPRTSRASRRHASARSPTCCARRGSVRRRRRPTRPPSARSSRS